MLRWPSGWDEVAGSVHQGDVGKRLGEVSEQSLRRWVVFLRERADIVPSMQKAFEDSVGVCVPALEGVIVGQPEGAGEERPCTAGPQTLEGIQTLDMGIPVCFITGNPGANQPSDLLQHGARHVFGKPFDLKLLGWCVTWPKNQWGSCKKIDSPGNLRNLKLHFLR
jgi:hypothetical protein